MFKVGQKVVCVDNNPHPGRGWPKGECPSKGVIYTIKDMWIDFKESVEVFEFVELNRPISSIMFGYKSGYAASRFRPVVERKTDISIFTAILNPAKTKERV